MAGETSINPSITLLEQDIAETLALVECHLPLTMQVLSFHLLHHICDTLRRYGTTGSAWMAYLESFNQHICSLIQNRRFPKESIASTYQLVDFGTFALTSEQRTDDMVYDALLKMDA